MSLRSKLSITASKAPKLYEHERLYKARRDAADDLYEAAADALAGWRYIREHHGDLYGVGWDRVESALTAALAKARGEQSDRSELLNQVQR